MHNSKMSSEPRVISFNSDPYFQKKPKLPGTRRQSATNRSTSHKVCSKLHVTGIKNLQHKTSLANSGSPLGGLKSKCFIVLFEHLSQLLFLCKSVQSCLPTDSNAKVFLLGENFELVAQDMQS